MRFILKSAKYNTDIAAPINPHLLTLGLMCNVCMENARSMQILISRCSMKTPYDTQLDIENSHVLIIITSIFFMAS